MSNSSEEQTASAFMTRTRKFRVCQEQFTHSVLIPDCVDFDSCVKFSHLQHKRNEGNLLTDKTEKIQNARREVEDSLDKVQ